MLPHSYGPDCLACSIGKYKKIKCRLKKPLDSAKTKKNQERSDTVSVSEHTSTPGKMFGILSSMSNTGGVSERTILAALQSNDDPLRAFIVRAVNAHEELLETLLAVKQRLEAGLENGYTFKIIDNAITKAEGK